MFEKDWKDELNDSKAVKIVVLQLKSWAQQARNISATLSVLNLINDREQLLLYVTDVLKSTSYMAYMLEEEINDQLREIKDGGAS